MYVLCKNPLYSNVVSFFLIAVSLSHQKSMKTAALDNLS